MKYVLSLAFILILGVVLWSSLCNQNSKYQNIKISLKPQVIPADGQTTTILRLEFLDEHDSIVRFNNNYDLLISNKKYISFPAGNPVYVKKGIGEVTLQSTVYPGSTNIFIANDNTTLKKIPIITTPVYTDSDSDGFPDVVELSSNKDRLHFREAFVKIAEAQLDSFSDKWNEDERDCSGLLRFAYREALKDHDSQWIQRIGFERVINVPQIEKYHYPDIPIIGKTIFRTNAESFSPSVSVDSVFSSFAKGQFLKNYNTVFLSRTPTDLEMGDLLFFLNTDDPVMPFHSMIYIGDDNNIPEPGNDDWLIYHTGPVDDTSGKMKKIRLSTLNNHPDKAWHTTKNNPHFLGYYRWKILD